MLDIAIVVIFFLINILIGVYSGRNITNFTEYSVWKRSFGSFAICASLTASFLGGGYIMGNSAKAYSIGMVYAYGLIGFSLKELLVGLFIAPKMSQYSDCHSVGDIIGRHYGAKAKLMTGIFSLLICIGILGSQVSAIGVLFSLFFKIPMHIGILIGFGIIIFYSALGGMRGVIYTDTFQFLIIMIGIPLILVCGVSYLGGWQHFIANVPPEKLNPFNHLHSQLAFFSLFMTFLVGEVLVPPYVQRLFMAKSTKETKTATVVASILSVPIFIIAGFIGLVALQLNPHLAANDSMPYVVKYAVPVGLKGIVIAGLISVIMSSASSFLNAGAIAFTHDVLPSIIEYDHFNKKRQLRIVRLVSVFLGIGAVIMAMSVQNILDILIYSYSVWAPVLLVQLVAAIYGKPVSVKGFFMCAGVGVIFTVITSVIASHNSLISPNVLGVLGSLITFWILKSKERKTC
ncbi:sodium:solute symporter family protein [Shewanella sp. 202IG2-18]|uniref:sodium:solute symporter family protein n=1 Tax=Parashewanella hymeniacidonis TaxID=2807618 RepID=UPI001961DF1D|nr:sodium:solute symporter family protein [Parashewanella hymeniacidonis]MBM7071671.1 sodium:solute symporter family protein [Parashewanella hymeniacidonis]